MNIQEIMTRDVVTCSRDDTVLQAASAMKQHDCGIVPVLEGPDESDVVGVITDRDIICRVVADDDAPSEVFVGDVMTVDVVNIHYRARFNAALRLMETHRVRRLLVTGDSGRLMGVVSLTDLAEAITKSKLGEVVQHLSKRS